MYRHGKATEAPPKGWRRVWKNEMSNVKLRPHTARPHTAAGFYNFRARWYDPVTGRWLSPDPIGISGGLNLYEAFANNPVNSRDPFGLDIYLENTPAVNGWHRRVSVDIPGGKGKYGQSFGMQRNMAMQGSSASSDSKGAAPGGAGSGIVYPDVSNPTTEIANRFTTTSAEDAWAILELQKELDYTGKYHCLTKNCRHYSKKKFKELVKKIKKRREQQEECP